MEKTIPPSSPDRRAKQAVLLWGVYILVNIVLNGTVPFALGVDLRSWTYSVTKDLLIHILVYAALFLVAPLILTKGWQVVRQPAFLVPLLIACATIAFRPFFRWSVALVPLVLVYLHWRFDLAELGFRSQGWKGDLGAVLILGFMFIIPVFFQPGPYTISILPAIATGLDRLFANPASTVENLFYFGFLTERLSFKTGRWLTPVLIGLMYTLHEMTNPEYWYEGMAFALVFIGVTITSSIYLWRRNVIAIWLGDGLGKLLNALISA